MTDSEKITAAVQMLKGRLYWLEKQQDAVSKKINSPRLMKAFDLGKLGERRCKLGREKIRIEVLLELFENDYLSPDIMPLFDGRNEDII